MTSPLLLTELEAASYLGITRWTLAKWRKKGLIAVVKVDPEVNRAYYRRGDLERFVDELAVEP